MSSEQNKYGLSRYIDADIKRTVRSECGFGCVCCGFAICSYEHIDPEFKDARDHNPQNIAFLCERCHSRVTRKFWSKEKIKNARKNPWSIKHGRCHDAFDISASQLTVWLGPNKIVNVPIIFQIEGKTILSIEPPEEVGGPVLLSGKFYDINENMLFEISKNEWIGPTTNWDIDCVGGTITIRIGHRKVALKIRTNPPNGIIIEKANMNYLGTSLKVDLGKVKVTAPDKSAIQMTGRTVIGTGEHAMLFSSTDAGGMEMGPGPFAILQKRGQKRQKRGQYKPPPVQRTLLTRDKSLSEECPNDCKT